MKHSLFIIGFAFLTLTSIAFAQNAGLFKDMPAQDTWYSTSVANLVNMEVMKGYSDGTFKPMNAVTRAELAVILDRYDQYVEHPAGKDEWKIYKNDNQKYSVFYPGKWKIVETGAQEGWVQRTEFWDVEKELLWVVTVYDGASNTKEDLMHNKELIADYRVVEENFKLNGINATRLVQTEAHNSSTHGEKIFVEANNKIYVLSTGLQHADFEHFVMTFVPAE